MLPTDPSCGFYRCLIVCQFPFHDGVSDGTGFGQWSCHVILIATSSKERGDWVEYFNAKMKSIGSLMAELWSNTKSLSSMARSWDRCEANSSRLEGFYIMIRIKLIHLDINQYWLNKTTCNSMLIIWNHLSLESSLNCCVDLQRYKERESWIATAILPPSLTGFGFGLVWNWAIPQLELLTQFYATSWLEFKLEDM